MKKMVICVVLIIGVWSCEVNERDYEMLEKKAFVSNSQIRPPLTNCLPTPECFQINNSTDTVLISAKGNYISIPKNCFINADGEGVVDDISISFNEYLNPSDILLSGIPMIYMEGEDTLSFQSAGMCEVLATNKHGPLTLKADKQIEIGLRSLAQDNDYNLYYFDTLSGAWLEKEKNLPVLLANELPIVPVNLQMADTNSILELNIENYQMRPLYRMWHRSKFCIYGEYKLISSDSSIWWYDMTINPTKNRDLYDLTFNGVDEDSRQYEYNLTVQPVIDSANYSQEFENFQSNMLAYIKALASYKIELANSVTNGLRVQTELAQVKIDEDVRTSAERLQDSLAMVEYLKEDSLRQIKRAIDDSLIVIQTQQWKAQKNERYKSNRTRVEVMRSFKINQMGVFNCDRFYKRPIVTTKAFAMIVDEKARRFDTAYLVDVKSNAVLNYLKFSVNSYLIDLDMNAYVFIGILGGEVYMTNLALDDVTEYENYIPMKHISTEELKSLLN